MLEYGKSQGQEGLIKAIQKYYHDWGMDYNLDDIYVTNGGSEAIAFAVMTTCDPGDNILMFEPFYANYKSFVGAYNVEISGVPNVSTPMGTTCPVKPRSKSTSIPGRGPF